MREMTRFSNPPAWLKRKERKDLNSVCFFFVCVFEVVTFLQRFP